MNNIHELAKFAKSHRDVHIKKITTPGLHLLYEYSISAGWLDDSNDEIEVVLFKARKDSPWALTDDSWLDDHCKSMGVYDPKYKSTDLTKTFLALRNNELRRFAYAPIHKKSWGYCLYFKSLKALDDRLHVFVQMIIQILSYAEFVRELRNKSQEIK